MKLATTLEELKEILTENVWCIGCPVTEEEHCLITAIDGHYHAPLSGYLRQALGQYSTAPLTVWNDKQTSVTAIHNLIDKAIELRDNA